MATLDNLVNIDDFEKQAKRVLPKQAADYYNSGAGAEFTLQLNRDIFSRFRIKPRFMRDVSFRDASTTVLGMKVDLPIGIAPTAMQRMAHSDGECANVQAAGELNTVFIQSTISTSSIEEVAAASKKAIKWFQLYIYKDRNVTLNLIRRAEASGFSALVLTVDAPFFGIRYADARNKFSLPPHLKMANFEGSSDNATGANSSRGGSGINEYVSALFDPSITWLDVKWLRSVTNLPIVLKGILSAEDAIIAANLEVAAIIVSNHGARQVDYVPASLEALQEIVKAVNGRCEVYMDGGIRSGTDVFIALALGAKFVFIGRPAVWGLACGGQKGVEAILKILRKELDSTMALTGCTSVNSITKEMVVPAELYHKL